MDDENFIPMNYQDWRHCITVKCGIPLTQTYVEERLRSFENKNSESTKRFIKLYGEEYTDQVIAWFNLAKHELQNR